jgi:hypothetical protein
LPTTICSSAEPKTFAASTDCTWPRRILGHEVHEARLDLLDHPFGREEGVHQVAVVQEGREAPVAAVALLHLLQFPAVVGEDRFSDRQVVGIVDLVPAPTLHPEALQVGVLQEGQDLEDLLVVFVFSPGCHVGLQEGNVVIPHEGPGELVDVYGFVVVLDVAPLEVGLVDDAYDLVVVVQHGHRAVHPALELGYDRQVRRRVREQLL